MLLADTQVKDLIEDQESGLLIEPFEINQLQGASYDIRIGKKILISGEDREHDLSREKTVSLSPGDFAVTLSHERFELPQNIVINIGPKTYLTKKGIILQAGMQIDPGFKGNLFLGLYNSSPRKFIIEYLGDLCSIQFFKLQEEAMKIFPISKNHETGEFSRDMKDYLYTLETKSLTSLGEDVRALTKNVGNMSERIADISSQVNSLKTIILSIAIPLGLGLLLIIIQNFVRP
jgi:deoxycytidine triphosphate deaminase